MVSDILPVISDDLRALTVRQQSLVDTLVTRSCTIKEAAKIAGYSKALDGESGRAIASKKLRLPHVREYLRERMRIEIDTVATAALQKMVGLLDADSEHVQLDAAKQLLDRAGHTKPSRGIHVNTAELNVHINLG
jgi:phage terminase small subunit